MLSPLLNIFFGVPDSKEFKIAIHSRMQENNFEILEKIFLNFIKEKKILKRQGFQNVPLSAWKTAPGIWSKKRLISVPSLGYCKQKDIKIYIKSNKII